jgi:hypothetical protein
MIAADLIYNVRSGLDHFAAALNPRKMRGNVMFPIFSEGVWDEGRTGENKEQMKARERWNTSTREMQPGAVAILKEMQPPESARDDAGNLHLLVLLNRLSNKDRHTELPLMPVGLADFGAMWQLPGSDQWYGGFERRTWGMVNDNAEIGVPDGAMNVKVTGTPKLAIRASGPDWEVEVPLYFDNLVNYVRNYVFTPLFPFLCVPPAKK